MFELVSPGAHLWSLDVDGWHIHGSYGSLKVLNLHFSIFKALKVLNLATRSLKVLNFIFVKSSLNIKIIVVFIILNCLWIIFFYTSIMSVSIIVK